MSQSHSQSQSNEAIPDDGRTMISSAFRSLESPNLEACKLVAVLAMVADHAAVLVLPDLLLLRLFGRLALPLFACVLAYNWRNNSRDRGALVRRLWIIAAIAQPVYVLAFDTWQLNILFTLAAGLSVSNMAGSIWSRWCWTMTTLYLLVLLEACGLPPILEYGPAGVLLVVMAAAQRWPVVAVLACWVNLQGLVAGNLLLGLVASLAVLVFVHSGAIGWRPPGMRSRWFWYGFYPAHLLLLMGTAWIADVI